jgi:hypothetical protein
MIYLNHILFPDHSRVWIYQADRKLSIEDQEVLVKNGSDFVSQWQAHGHDLTAGFFVVLDHFVIMVVDEQMETASGCSIDKSMHLILGLQKELGINFTNRMISALYINDQVVLYPYAEVKQALETGKISGETLVFDNTITNLSTLKTSWLKPLKDTWLKKLLTSERV